MRELTEFEKNRQVIIEKIILQKNYDPEAKKQNKVYRWFLNQNRLVIF